MVNNQCYICNNIVFSETNNDIRDKYYNIIGNKLYHGSHLCYICVHLTLKFWSFKTACLNRAIDIQYGFEEELNWSLLFRLTKDTEKIHNLQSHNFIYTLCPEGKCLDNQSAPCNSANDYDVIQDLCANNAYNANLSEPVDSGPVVEDQKQPRGEIASECVTSEEKQNNILNEEQNDTELDNEQYVEGFNDYAYHSPADVGAVDGDVDEPNADCDEKVLSNDGTIEENEINDSPEANTKLSKKKNKKIKKKSFIKRILSFEEQKLVLDQQRKEKRYSEAEFKCYSCALGFLFKDSYQSHMVRHEESNGQFSCNVCSLRFATQNVRCMHLALHSERYTCRKCGDTVKRPHRRKHMNECWEENRDSFSCHMCGKVFKDSCGLQQHLKRFHLAKTNKRSYSCNICGKTYTDQGARRTHMIKHSNRRFECDQCSSTFNSPYTLAKHVKTHTNDPRSYCATCNTWYKTEKHLREHLRNSTRHQQFSYECPVCGRVCPTRRALELHMDSNHSSEKPYACDHCPARYTTRKSLIRHVKIHTQYVQVKELICHLCGKSYRGKSKLNRHLKDICERSRIENEFTTMFNENSACPLP